MATARVPGLSAKGVDVGGGVGVDDSIGPTVATSVVDDKDRETVVTGPSSIGGNWCS